MIRMRDLVWEFDVSDWFISGIGDESGSPRRKGSAVRRDRRRRARRLIQISRDARELGTFQSPDDGRGSGPASAFSITGSVKFRSEIRRACAQQSAQMTRPMPASDSRYVVVLHAAHNEACQAQERSLARESLLHDATQRRLDRTHERELKQEERRFQSAQAGKDRRLRLACALLAALTTVFVGEDLADMAVEMLRDDGHHAEFAPKSNERKSWDRPATIKVPRPSAGRISVR